MSMMAISRAMAPHRPASPTPLSSPIMSLDHINTSTSCPLPIPNKHLPICPTGPSTADKPDTPPASPPTKHNEIPSHSILYPPTDYTKISSRSGLIYCIDAAGVAAALKHIAGQPLPESSKVFPWYHGLHAQNQIQQAFFIARKRSLRRTPRCLRGITLVKADGDLNRSRLKGAIAPDEILRMGNDNVFREIDPRDGFSVRNFQIQTCKTAMVSDIIVYGEDEIDTRTMAWKVAAAQQAWRNVHEASNQELPQYNTFICTTPFEEFESDYPDLVTTTSKGQVTGKVMDFFYQERLEMSTMTAASEIAPNVWLGPTPDPSINPDNNHDAFDVFIECGDMAQMNAMVLENLATNPSRERQYLEFPSSGSIMPPSWNPQDADSFLTSIQWIHAIATGIRLTDGSQDDVGKPDSFATMIVPRKILLHCTDGYTETSLLALAYYIYVTGSTVAQAWKQLHCEKKRNFFAYSSDVALLNAICPKILELSPALEPDSRTPSAVAALLKRQPTWLGLIDGSLPSRITNYMYLGNLGHANNPEMLKELGIGQVLSVGELVNWTHAEIENWGEENIMRVQGVQDNGIDELWGEFERCLEFIAKGRRNATATLVHCRVGVSRSATICIAEIMRDQNLSYPRAYCFVRARRLNVIIQPHLRFSYELLKWEEELGRRNFGENGKWWRELEWESIAREIAAMNRPYSR